MPDNYTILGDYRLGSSSEGNQRCVRNANNAYDIPYNLQPRWHLNDAAWNLTKWYNSGDDLGWSYSYLETSNHTYTAVIKELIDVLPDDNPDMPHAVVKACRPELVPQPYVLVANPNWKVVGFKSVIYEGEVSATVAPLAVEESPDPIPTYSTLGTHTRAGDGEPDGSVSAGWPEPSASSRVSTSPESGPAGSSPGLESKSLGSMDLPWSILTVLAWIFFTAALLSVR